LQSEFSTKVCNCALTGFPPNSYKKINNRAHVDSFIFCFFIFFFIFLFFLSFDTCRRSFSNLKQVYVRKKCFQTWNLRNRLHFSNAVQCVIFVISRFDREF
jgi:hypothetical protein